MTYKGLTALAVFTASFGMTIAVVPPLVAQTGAQNQAVVTKAMNLRSGPSISSAKIAGLKATAPLILLDPNPKNGFYHVRATHTTDGWISAQGVEVGGTAASPVAAAKTTRALIRKPMNREMEPVTPGLAPAKCAPDLAACPATGCAAAASAHALANQLKRATPTGTVPVMFTFDDFAGLQQQADDLVGQGHDPTAAKRALLTGLTVSGGTVAEGSLVGLVGYLVATPHANTKESVNCNLTGETNNDFHIPMSNDPNNLAYQGIVVEMIPQDRPDAWTISNLTQVASNQQLVMVTGSLYYDGFHKVNADPNSPVGGQPARFSLWEVHPLSTFVVCTKNDNSCDPARPEDWAQLGQ